MARNIDLYIDQGAYFNQKIVVKNQLGAVVNLAGYNVQAQMSKSYFTIKAKEITLNALISNAATGEVILELSVDETNNIRAGRYVYELEIIDADGNITRVADGIVTVNPRAGKVR